jgi:hypothetical protein
MLTPLKTNGLGAASERKMPKLSRSNGSEVGLENAVPSPKKIPLTSGCVVDSARGVPPKLKTHPLTNGSVGDLEREALQWING